MTRAPARYILRCRFYHPEELPRPKPAWHLAADLAILVAFFVAMGVIDQFAH